MSRASEISEALSTFRDRQDPRSRAFPDLWPLDAARGLLSFTSAMVLHNSTPFRVRWHRRQRTARALCSAFVSAALLILVTGRLSEAQQIDLPSAAAPTPAVQSGVEQAKLAVTGCAAAGTTEQTKITFVDQHHNLWYRATNKGLHLTDSRHLYVIGGLLPTWNLAAQAGATDPGPTFTAMQWTLPNQQIGASPYAEPKVRIAWIPSASLNGPCRTP